MANLGAAEGRAIVAAVVGLAQALHLETVAEGVETAEQAAVLTGLGCHAAQGFLYAPPLALDEVGQTGRYGHLSERGARAGTG